MELHSTHWMQTQNCFAFAVAHASQESLTDTVDRVVGLRIFDLLQVLAENG